MFLETVAATLLAPVLAFLQSHFVVGILMGKNMKWDAQDRGEAETTYGEAVRRHWPSTLLGVVWSVLLVTTARNCSGGSRLFLRDFCWPFRFPYGAAASVLANVREKKACF